MNKFSRLRVLFNTYLAKQCTPAELEELLQLLQEADAEDALEEDMRLLWQTAKKTAMPELVDWQKMYQTVVSSEKEANMILNRASATASRRRYIIAAITVLIIALPVYWLISRQADKSQPPIAATEKVNTNDQHSRQTIHLPDGSTVVLNAASTLNYPPVFNAHRRDVYLAGEGFFDIKHNATQPFYVHAGKLVIKVLGTAFNIRSYLQQENIEITVTRGKVQVLKEDQPLATLTASQQLSFQKTKETIATATVDTMTVTAWKPAEIHFTDISLEEAADKLERRFNVRVEFSNQAVKKCRVSATFSEDDRLEEILTVICAVTQSEYTVSNNKIIINGKGCN